MCGFLRSLVSGIPDHVHEARMARRCDIARCLTSLLVTQRQQWGTERMHPSMIPCVAVGCFTLLEGLDSSANREASSANREASSANREALIALCTVARDFGRRISLARGVLQMVELGAKQIGITLPPETYQLFREFEPMSSEESNLLWYNSLYLSALSQFLQDGHVWTDVSAEDIDDTPAGLES